MTPFGFPVEPDVYRIAAKSFSTPQSGEGSSITPRVIPLKSWMGRAVAGILPFETSTTQRNEKMSERTDDSESSLPEDVINAEIAQSRAMWATCTGKSTLLIGTNTQPACEA